MRKLIPILLFVLAGCAAYKTFNQTTTGRIVLRGGVFQKEEWSTALTMRRMSWYHGMTLYYDAVFWKANPDSPFAMWFSASEKEFFTKCETFLVTAGYSADPSKISHVNFREQMKLNGYDDVVLNNFSAFLKSHPQATDWRLSNYKVVGYCKRSPTRLNTSNVAINFAGFQNLELDL